ncbi:MAG: hypothetical protein AAGI08_01060 [Bacteroidota bacterium]
MTAQPSVDWVHVYAQNVMIPETRWEVIVGLDTDADHNIYLAGSLLGTADLDPDADGGDSDTLRTAPEAQGPTTFVVSYDQAGGLRWKFSLPVTRRSTPTGLAVDERYVYVVGKFSGRIDLDPGPLDADETASGFVAAYERASGAFVWGGSVRGDRGVELNSVATDGELVYVTGAFSGLTDFAFGRRSAPGVPFRMGERDIFIAAYSTRDGALEWLNTYPSPGLDLGHSLAVLDGQLFAVGQFQEILRLDEEEELVPSPILPSSSIAFLAAFEAESGEFNWSQMLQGASISDLAALNDKVVLSGSYGWLAQFETDPLTRFVRVTEQAQSADAFIASYEADDGTPNWVETLNSLYLNFGHAVTLTNTSVYATGWVGGDATTSPGSAALPLAASNPDQRIHWDAFIIARDLDSGILTDAFTIGTPLNDGGYAIAAFTEAATDRIVVVTEFEPGSASGLGFESYESDVPARALTSYSFAVPTNTEGHAVPSSDLSPDLTRVASGAGVLRVSLKAPQEGVYHTTVYDMMGRRVLTGPVLYAMKNHVVYGEVSLASLAPGRYALVAQHENEVETLLFNLTR